MDQQLKFLGEPEELREAAADFLAEARVEADEGVVRNVALLAPASRNGYRYTLEAMRNAAPLYEGRPVFVDHADPAAPTQRKLRDFAGQVVNPRFENDRVRGDLRLVGANSGWLMELIRSAPKDIGMSHVVLARRTYSGDEVQTIEKVVSVDIVAFPATTQSFAEGTTAGKAHAVPPVGAADEALRELVEQSRIPVEGRIAGLYRLLKSCPEPRTVVALLEDYWREALAETPRSSEKSSSDAANRTHAAYARQALMAAICGR